MRLLKQNNQGTHVFQAVKEFRLSELRSEIQVQEHFVNWNAQALDDITEDVIFVHQNPDDKPNSKGDIIYYYSTSFSGREYHLAIDEMDLDELFVRAVKAEEDGYFEFASVPADKEEMFRKVKKTV